MCGICGVYGDDGAASLETVRRMCALIRHRGPDGEGLYSSGRLAMGMRRLAIIDLSTGDQPVYNEDRTLAVVLNGEIYNYVELREELKARGHRFATASDTEVVVHLYEEYGDRAFALLNGFFAFALHDTRSGELRVVRDRWGIKPLYYLQDGGPIAFASEVKAFRALGRSFPLHRGALWDLFSYGYLPAEETLLEGVRLLKPGCFLKLSPGKTEEIRYHRLAPNPDWARLGEEEAREIYAGKVRDAVKLALRSDVPVGLFLSAGLDSNIILHEARRYLPGKVRTYTVGVESGHVDESGIVRRLAAEQGLDSVFLSLTPGWIKENFRRLAAFHDSPAVTPAFLALAMLSEAAAKDLKVVLSGTGGDELLMGYPTYQADKLWPWFSRLPGPLKTLLAAGAGRLPHPPGRVSAGYKLKKFAEGLSYPFEKAHYSWRTIFGDAEKDALLSADYFAGARRDSFGAYERAFREAPAGLGPLERASFADIKVWMANMGHIQSDTFTMHASLEMRPPLLENGLADFLYSLPTSLKMKGLGTKSFLRGCYRGRLPAYIVDQPKMGFHLPMAEWLRGGLRGFAEERLRSPEAGRFFRPGEAGRVLDGHLGGRVDNSFKIFTIICFLEWVEQHRGLVGI